MPTSLVFLLILILGYAVYKITALARAEFHDARYELHMAGRAALDSPEDYRRQASARYHLNNAKSDVIQMILSLCIAAPLSLCEAFLIYAFIFQTNWGA